MTVRSVARRIGILVLVLLALPLPVFYGQERRTLAFFWHVPFRWTEPDPGVQVAMVIVGFWMAGLLVTLTIFRRASRDAAWRTTLLRMRWWAVAWTVVLLYVNLFVCWVLHLFAGGL